MLENHVFSNFSIYLFYTYSEYPMGIRYPTHTHTRILLSAITILLYMIVCNDSCIKLWPQRFFWQVTKRNPQNICTLTLFAPCTYVIFQHSFSTPILFTHAFWTSILFTHAFWTSVLNIHFFQTSILNIHFFQTSILNIHFERPFFQTSILNMQKTSILKNHLPIFLRLEIKS